MYQMRRHWNAIKEKFLQWSARIYLSPKRMLLLGFTAILGITFLVQLFLFLTGADIPLLKIGANGMAFLILLLLLVRKKKGP